MLVDDVGNGVPVVYLFLAQLIPTLSFSLSYALLKLMMETGRH